MHHVLLVVGGEDLERGAEHRARPVADDRDGGHLGGGSRLPSVERVVVTMSCNAYICMRICMHLHHDGPRLSSSDTFIVRGYALGYALHSINFMQFSDHPAIS
eukprot:SAG22_NODE_2022_length_3123_cov_12.497354_7_plen_103_part_00